MLYQKITALYPSLTKADFGLGGTIQLRNDGEGDYIASWNHPTLAQPTQEQLDAVVIDPNAPYVPQSITPRQVRLILLQQGLLAQIEGLIAAQDDATRIAWEYAVDFQRHDSLLTTLAGYLDPPLTPEQIDQLFIAAAAL